MPIIPNVYRANEGVGSMAEVTKEAFLAVGNSIDGEYCVTELSRMITELMNIPGGRQAVRLLAVAALNCSADVLDATVFLHNGGFLAKATNEHSIRVRHEMKRLGMLLEVK